MSIKAKTTGCEAELVFPMLICSHHLYGGVPQIILVTGINNDDGSYVGTNVNGVGNSIGYFSTSWSEDMKPWYGKIEIIATEK